MSNGNVNLQYDLTSGQCAFYWQDRTIISSFYAGVGLSAGYVKGTNYTQWSWCLVSSNEVMVTAVGIQPTMNQYFILDQTNSFLTRVEMDDSALSANWMGPVVVDRTGGVNIGAPGDLRALFVPFDNDHFISYNAMPINSSDTSYEVGAFYDNVSRAGLVVGSVTHDVWKSGVFWSGANNALNQMNVFGGAVSSSVTWDVMPHGSVTGNVITSPTVFVGYGPDWRSVMESYAAENVALTPGLAWTNGVPFGWNSWGMLTSSVNYFDATNASGFVKRSLQSNSFNNNDVVYINLDSYWDNLSDDQVQSFVKYCHANGQKAGVYFTPWVFWGAADESTNWGVEGTSYAYDQVLLRTRLIPARLSG
jgi:alpha-galactosidase